MDAGLQLKLLLLVVWIGFVVFSAKKFVLAKTSTNWPKVKAIVKSSCLKAKRVGDGHTYYSPDIEYQYSLDSKHYSSNNFTYMGTFGLSKEYSDKYINKYTVGSEIEVSYNPKTPEVAVIIPGVHWGQYTSMLLLTLIFFCCGHIVEIINYMAEL